MRTKILLIAAMVVAALAAVAQAADIPSHVDNSVTGGDTVEILDLSGNPERIGWLSVKCTSGTLSFSCWSSAGVKRMPEANSPNAEFELGAGETVNLSPLWDVTEVRFTGSGAGKLMAGTRAGR